MKYRINSKEKRISLGVYPEVGLKEARDKCDAARKQIADDAAGLVLADQG